MNDGQPHIIHEKRTERYTNMHRLVVDGVPGLWVRAWDEFAVCRGFAASPWNQPSMPSIFEFKIRWATVVEPNKVAEFYTDSDLGLDKLK